MIDKSTAYTSGSPAVAAGGPSAVSAVMVLLHYDPSFKMFARRALND
jgi:hypothetical protein